jgi:hypothetical protein
MKKKLYNTVGTVPTSNIKLVEIDTPNGQIHFAGLAQRLQ